MAKNILEEAIEDIKKLEEAAHQNAKSLLIEALSPSVKQMIQKEMTNLVGEAEDDEENDEEQASCPEDGKDLEEEGMYEVDDTMSGIDVVDEKVEEDDEDENQGDEKDMEETIGTEDMEVKAEGKDEEEEKEDEVEESVEISEADLRKALAETLGLRLTEAEVTKGFGDVEDPDEDETGLLDKEKSEKQWKDAEAPAAKDWTVKEAKLQKQIKSLKKEVSLYKEALSYMKNHMNEVHVFNSKLVHTNKLLHKAALTEAQKLAIIEAFDGAKTKREVELVYKSLSESLKISGVVTESRKMPASSKVAKSSKTTRPSSTVLQESAKKEAAGDSDWARQLRLAGLVD